MKTKGSVLIPTTVAIGIGLSIMGFFWTTITKVESKAEDAKQGVIEAKESVKDLEGKVDVIVNDVSWIRSYIETNKTIK